MIANHLNIGQIVSMSLMVGACLVVMVFDLKLPLWWFTLGWLAGWTPVLIGYLADLRKTQR